MGLCKYIFREGEGLAVKTKRHAKILEIISSNVVDTQEELLVYLKKAGFDVTQATVSRDIKELRLIKALGSDGRYRYSTVRQEAGNIVVVKCLSGMAQAACAAMDSLHWDYVVGTLAGEDTFICITKDENRAVGLVTDLKKLLK